MVTHWPKGKICVLGAGALADSKATRYRTVQGKQDFTVGLGVTNRILRFLGRQREYSAQAGVARERRRVSGEVKKQRMDSEGTASLGFSTQELGRVWGKSIGEVHMAHSGNMDCTGALGVTAIKKASPGLWRESLAGKRT